MQSPWPHVDRLAVNRTVGDAALNVRRAVGAARAGVGHGVDKVRASIEQVGSASPWPSSVPAQPGAACGPPDPQASLPGPLEIRVCSWNLHGKAISASDDLARLLAPPDAELPDLMVVGVQELVELGARSVMLNTTGDEHRQAALEAHIERALRDAATRQRHGGFAKVCSFGMVGLALAIYIRKELRPYLRDLDLDRVKTGLEGIGGNKGGICARFQLGSLSMCFVNVHLASGQHATQERGQHLTQIASDAFQGTSSRGASRPAKHVFQRASRYSVLSHHLVIVLGDFNSRLEVPKDMTSPPGSQRDWLGRDQLLLGLFSATLRGFQEGVIDFAPTYKRVAGTSNLSSTRCPAWCDRIIFKAMPFNGQVDLVEYSSCPELLHTSDHLPVAAQFSLAGGDSLADVAHSGGVARPASVPVQGGDASGLGWPPQPLAGFGNAPPWPSPECEPRKASSGVVDAAWPQSPF
eukprot:TRINITY_DN26711_c0_g1_i1.p1 TRINITY_DN26711_c0_g1~~TRINITY_DN26711_c0_g1_i1.p1  ORF type:complete len:466 (-),score=81.32 TRINITY_DN26711_c0_g1_i1:55-1452(-)